MEDRPLTFGEAYREALDAAMEEGWSDELPADLPHSSALLPILEAEAEELKKRHHNFYTRDWKRRNAYPTTRRGRQFWQFNRGIRREVDDAKYRFIP